MQPDCVLGAATRPIARLLIHAHGDAGAPGTYIEAGLQWLRALCPAGARYRKRAPLNLRIEDLRGHPMVAIEDGGPQIELALPAGTYHVIARVGDECRCYTMMLDEGRLVDLYLRFGSRPARARS